ncbi:MAG: glycoside hydrolase [Ruminococcaceae bacterium]|nr:glycoside hydrolase [Oscillospiraceae bacterium]
MDEYNMYRQQKPEAATEPVVCDVQPVPVKRAGFLNILPLILSVVALVLSVWALIRTLPPGPGAGDTDPNGVFAQPGTVITYKDRQLPAFTQVGLSRYDPACFVVSDGRVTYAQEGKTALTGVDVSFYQKDIDWQQVKASGIDFAIIRVGFRGYGPSGLISEDSCFRQNIAGALEAGLQVGVYFFSQAINVWEAREEANFVLGAIQGYDITFPVVFDWERIANNSSARTNGLPGSTMTLCAQAFCDTVSQAGYTPMVYFNQDAGYLDYDLDLLKDYSFWLAEYRTAPTFYYHFDLWQYTAKGQVPGIEGAVDLNLCFVDYGKEA